MPISQPIMQSKRNKKPLQQMTAKELAKATARYNEEFIIDRSVEQNALQKARWQCAKHKRKDSH
jgi:hypothetical protein